MASTSKTASREEDAPNTRAARGGEGEQRSISGMGEPGRTPEQSSVEAEERVTQRGLIFIVEDEAPVRRLLTWAMTGKGWDVRSAGDAETALRLVLEVRPDVLLVDVRLPGMDGVEFARAVRSEPGFADLPLVLMSAYERPRQEVADGFIPKPFDVDHLARLVSNLVERQQR